MSNSVGGRLSKSEWQVMAALWHLPDGGTAAEIRELLDRRSGIRFSSPSGLLNLLSRCVDKGFATSSPKEPSGAAGRPELHYRPAVPRVEAVEAEVERFLITYILDSESLDLLLRKAMGRLEKERSQDPSDT